MADDEYGLSSGDEAELLQLSDKAVNGHGSFNSQNELKRKSEVALSSVAKKQRSNLSPALDVATKVLNERFQLPAFRLRQADAISRLLDGGSAVVVFPTGGGKSLCYQVPALCFKEMDRLAGIRQGHAESGITLVVSPLIALMKDQVDALVSKGISAASMDSSKSKDQYLATVDAMREGTLDILYCAPERLNNEGFVATMANVKGGVRLLAVDEAHCISEWGHAFRPDYLKVARFAREIEAERVVCLTATATPKVAEDVCRAFDIPSEVGLFRTTTYRPNLKLHARSFNTKKESYPQLMAFLRAHPGPTIIYVTLQKHTEQLAENLRNNGFQAKPFHAGMDAQLKTSTQEMFMASKNLIIVATIAFGMGIDKADIRNVIHYDVPRSLEGYSQEIGRAGRDGLPSHCLLYLCAEDFHLRESFARGDLPSKPSVSKLLDEIFESNPSETGHGNGIEVALFQQSKDFDIKQGVLKNIYAQLELNFGFLRETTPKYTAYKYKSIVPTFFDKSKAAEALRNASKKAVTWTSVDVDIASRTSGVSRPELVAKLNDWNDLAYIDMATSGVMNIYRVLKPWPKTVPQKHKIVDELYDVLAAREERELEQMDETIELVTSRSCYALTLAEHFGDGLPEGRDRCGECTWCETGKVVQLIKPAPKPFHYPTFKKVLAACPQRDDARFLARVAFGISSPRVTQEKLGKNAVFGSMEDHDFVTLLNAFAKVCNKENQKVG